MADLILGLVLGALVGGVAIGGLILRIVIGRKAAEHTDRAPHRPTW